MSGFIGFMALAYLASISSDTSSMRGHNKAAMLAALSSLIFAIAAVVYAFTEVFA